MNRFAELPPWLAPGVLATCDRTLFVVDRAQKAKPPAKTVVLLSGRGDRYPLSGCHQARLSDIHTAQEFVDRFGKTCQVMAIEGVTVTLSDGDHVAKVRLPQAEMDITQAALSFARAFDGEIVEDWEGV